MVWSYRWGLQGTSNTLASAWPTWYTSGNIHSAMPPSAASKVWYRSCGQKHVAAGMSGVTIRSG